MRARTILAATLALALGASDASAYVPERTPRRSAEAAVDDMVSQRPARGTVPGIVVMRGGRVLVGINADRAMVPASLMKLPTTTAAMVRFGPRHRFATRVTAPRRAAVVDRLYLIGGGDPTFATRAYRRRRFLPKATDEIQRPAFASGSPTVEQLAARVAAAGIRRVDGPIVADETMFDTVRTQAGWLPSYLNDDPDVSYLSALMFNEGRAGRRRDRLLPSPAAAAARSLAAALRARGVAVTGDVRLGRTPRGTAEIARVQSPPLAEIIDFVNRYSVNLPAEMLVKSLGAAFGEAGTTSAGVRVIEDTLASLDTPLAGLSMSDGSGLSVLNRITPRTLAHLLDRMLTGKGDGYAALRASLPVAGGPGTLLTRMRGAPTGGNLRGKTGSIRRVRGMAGWVTASDGIPVVYVALFNEARSPFALTAPLDSFGRAVAGFPAP